MEFYEDGEDIVSFWKPQKHYQGWINTLHGGIICTLLDETAGWVVFRKLQTSGVTSQIEVRYRRPVMTTDTQLSLRGHLTEMKRNLAFIDVTLENSKGEICAEARAVYYTFTQEKAREMGFDKCETEGEEMLF